MRDSRGRFLSGHTRVGGMMAGAIHTKSAKAKISDSLRGKIGEESRRWKGDDASYIAKHMWLYKHYGKATRCENPNCQFKNPKRYEWANISGEHRRDRLDYMMLCP